MKTVKRLVALLLTAATFSAVGAPAVKTFEPATLEQIAASHRGKPFLLLVWSMDCEFCQASLDFLAKARAADPTLDIVTVTTDPTGDRELTGQVSARLSSIGLLGDSWGFGAASPERLRYTIDPAWRGEKPRTYLYDAAGGRTAFSGLIKPERLAKWRATARSGKDVATGALRR